MNIFDILGPVMIGPSSSHTAGAVKLGYVARNILGGQPRSAKIYLHGSFADTGKGHGTDRALVAGLLGMKEDDERIPFAFEEAAKVDFLFEIEKVQLLGVHPNTAVLKLEGDDGRKLHFQGSSIGGSRIIINQIDHIDVECSAEYPTLIVYNRDLPGYVAEVTSKLAAKSINIATMKLFRGKRGAEAVMIIESDQPIEREVIKSLETIDGILKVTYIAGI